MRHETRTWAFGDDKLDLPILAAVDEAVLVVGDRRGRFQSMHDALATHRDNGLNVRMVVVPKSSSHRVSGSRLPLADITAPGFVTEISKHPGMHGRLQLHHGTDSEGAKLLANPIRGELMRGKESDEAHIAIGGYLARRYLTELIGVERCILAHSHGKSTTGYRLRKEDQILIVALLPRGEKEAKGVHQAFPMAELIRARRPNQISKEQLEDKTTVILVDYEITDSGPVTTFIKSIRDQHASIRVIVVACVIEDEEVSGCSPIRALARTIEVNIVALRLSKKKPRPMIAYTTALVASTERD